MLEWLAALPPAAMLRRWDTAYLLVNAAHIAAIGLLFGSIAALDLRLLGLMRQMSQAAAAASLPRLAAAGALLAVATGLLLFAVQPRQYVANPAFLVKVAIVAAGIANALWLRHSTHWARLLAGGPVTLRVRTQAAVSLGLWLAAIVAGRWIGFV